MKKLLVFREGVCPEAREVEDYLYNSEVIRSDFIDMGAEVQSTHQSGTLSLYSSTWEIVFKDSDKFDYWHLVAEGTQGYAFEEASFKAATGLIEPFKGPHVLLTAVVHKRNTMVLIYRLKKKLSALLDLHLPLLLDSFKDGEYRYVIPENDLGSTNASLQKEEDAENAKAAPAGDPPA